MYLLFALIGLLIGGFTSNWDGGHVAIGALIGVVVAIIFKLLGKLFSSGNASAFDGCLLLILLEGISD